jgi:ATP-dependent 26S proteasome regulatory subunit
MSVAKPLNQELEVFLRARFVFMVLVTTEEERALQIIREVCMRIQCPCVTWDVSDGFQHLFETKGSLPTARDAKSALEQIDKAQGEALYVLKDFHECWKNFEIKRKLRSVTQRMRSTKKAVLVISSNGTVPDELRDEAVIVELRLPDANELAVVLAGLTESPGVRVNLTPLGREKLLQAALGLSASQAQRVLAKAIVSEGVLDDRSIELVALEKKQIIRESKALEFYTVTESPDDVGGLEILKEWLQLRERAFTREARDYGLPSPKGIALIGIPGTGKSLTAKMIGGLWRLPLLRLDVGALFGGLVGESEENTRRALRLAETVAPCIVWIDEIEKALAQGGLDGGTSMRVFGSILTWMAEKTAPCFVVATANDISRLPPELLRKGRFDEIFFLDLPTEAERREILRVHLAKRKRVPLDFDLDRLARDSEGYVGAELEQAVVDAMYIGFNDQRREFTTLDVAEAIRRQVPLSVSQRETVTALRNWLQEGRAQRASRLPIAPWEKHPPGGASTKDR